jgi:hypothetical protein
MLIEIDNFFSHNIYNPLVSIFNYHQIPSPPLFCYHSQQLKAGNLIEPMIIILY